MTVPAIRARAKPRLANSGLALLCLLCATNIQALSLGVHPEEPAPTLAQLLETVATETETVVVREFTSQADLIRALQNGSLDAALIEAPATAIEQVQLIADLYPSVLHILYRKDMPAADLPTLLRSGSIWAGGPGSIGEQLVTNLASDYGLDSAQVSLLPDPIAKTPDVWFIFGGILNSDALSRLQDFSLFSLGDSTATAADGVATGIALRYPTLHTMELPSQLYPQLNNRRITTLAANTQLVVRAGLDEEAAYQLAAMVDQAKPVLAAQYPFVALDDSTAVGQSPHALPLHRGALRFADRYKPTFLERYAEVFAFMLTALVALASATVALRRYQQQRRKDRLDRFFQQLLVHRDSSGEDGNNAKAVNAIQGLQSEVIELVVAERISADGALIAFLALSNQLLQEARAEV
ncbi:MAG: TAXI family TRAP transporter solute-binding subunit [Pseudomonadales bacterium]